MLVSGGPFYCNPYILNFTIRVGLVLYFTCNSPKYAHYYAKYACFGAILPVF